ncbi:reverse transcriptase domain-containing protein [Tanacetum coccineum]
MTITRSGMTPKAIEELIKQRVAEALAVYEANRAAELAVESQSQNGDYDGNGNVGGNGNKIGGGNGDENDRGNENENGGGNGNGNPNRNDRGVMPVARECTYHDFVKCQPLNFKGIEGVALTWWNAHKRTIGADAAFEMSWRELMKLMTERFQELTMMCTKMVPEEEDRVEKFIRGLPNNIQGNVIATEPTRLQDAVRIANNLMDQKLKGYAMKNVENKRRALVVNQRVPTCFECGRHRHYRSECPKLKNQTHGNKAGKKTKEARGKAYVPGEGEANPDSNIVTGTFLINNHYASMLFDSGADRSFVSSTFSALLDVIPSTLDVSYPVKLTDKRISKTNTVLRGYTLGLLGHPFNIDLMPIELGSFDVIISMD